TRSAERRLPPQPAANAGVRPYVRQEFGDDPQALIRRIPSLFAQDRSQDRQTAQPRHLQVAGGGREARAGGAVLQAALSELHPKIALGLPPSLRQMASPCRFIGKSPRSSTWWSASPRASSARTSSWRISKRSKRLAPRALASCWMRAAPSAT